MSADAAASSVHVEVSLDYNECIGIIQSNDLENVVVNSNQWGFSFHLHI